MKWAYFTIILLLSLSLFSSFQHTYLLASSLYQEEIYRYQDCLMPHYSARYPTTCANSVLHPPKSFAYLWTRHALGELLNYEISYPKLAVGACLSALFIKFIA